MLPERKQILVVDDEANLRKVLSAQLSRDGYDVHVAEDGEAGLAFLREHHIDLVITDLRMPKLDGMGLIASFRKALVDCKDVAELAQACAAALANGNKAEFALNLLYSDEIDDLKVPAYIHTGLAWLAEQLKRKEQDMEGKPAEVAV